MSAARFARRTQFFYAKTRHPERSEGTVSINPNPRHPEERSDEGPVSIKIKNVIRAQRRKRHK
jgi:hypothetical protein